MNEDWFEVQTFMELEKEKEVLLESSFYSLLDYDIVEVFDHLTGELRDARKVDKIMKNSGKGSKENDILKGFPESVAHLFTYIKREELICDG